MILFFLEFIEWFRFVSQFTDFVSFLSLQILFRFVVFRFVSFRFSLYRDSTMSYGSAASWSTVSLTGNKKICHHQSPMLVTTLKCAVTIVNG
jgi:hypothetical protein